MTTLVFVHGAFHGAWCWVKLLPELEARGHKGIALDMPGNGEDRTPMSQVTFDSYGKRIAETILRQAEPVVLVGHSLGCQSIALAAEMHPDRIRRLVFLAGCVPQSGLSLYSFIQVLNGQTTILMAPPAEHPWHGVSQMPPLDQVASLYYNDCSEEDIAYAKARLCEQSNAPRVTPVHLSADRFGRVPRAFIGCTLDNANTPAMQKANLTLFFCAPVITLPTSHSPFFSNPTLLADKLAKLS
jgi:pimeloyl-ACP methyl ester carboxylesterase